MVSASVTSGPHCRVVYELCKFTLHPVRQGAFGTTDSCPQQDLVCYGVPKILRMRFRTAGRCAVSDEG